MQKSVSHGDPAGLMTRKSGNTDSELLLPSGATRPVDISWWISGSRPTPVQLMTTSACREVSLPSVSCQLLERVLESAFRWLRISVS